jgi:phosphatidylglycerophosphatase A
MRPTFGFMAQHPAHWIALGFGSGLSPKAPGTVGTLWAWVSWWVLSDYISRGEWGWVILASTLIGWWACKVTALNMGISDPGAIVWDEVVAFWLVLWVLSPGSFFTQLFAFGLFRFFDAAKPGPVAWADPLAFCWTILWPPFVRFCVLHFGELGEPTHSAALPHACQRANPAEAVHDHGRELYGRHDCKQLHQLVWL